MLACIHAGKGWVWFVQGIFVTCLVQHTLSYLLLFLGVTPQAKKLPIPVVCFGSSLKASSRNAQRERLIAQLFHFLCCEVLVQVLLLLSVSLYLDLWSVPMQGAFPAVSLAEKLHICALTERHGGRLRSWVPRLPLVVGTPRPVSLLLAQPGGKSPPEWSKRHPSIRCLQHPASPGHEAFWRCAWGGWTAGQTTRRSPPPGCPHLPVRALPSRALLQAASPGVSAALPRALCRPSPVPAAFPVRQLRPRRPGERDGSESRVWATKHGEQRGHAAVTAPRWVSWRDTAPALRKWPEGGYWAKNLKKSPVYTVAPEPVWKAEGCGLSCSQGARLLPLHRDQGARSFLARELR